MTGVAELQGHWRRAWIKAEAFEDHSTAVHWLQCGDAYVDLRVPADLPDLSGVKTLADLPADVLLSLMACEGFAGTIAVEDSICTWDRAINWHGTPKTVDAGRMWFDAAGQLIEDGVHADYRELWVRAPERPQDVHVFDCESETCIAVLSDTTFALGVGARVRPPSAAVIAALEAGRKPQALAAHFASFYAYGQWDGRKGTATLSTNPLARGQTVLLGRGDTVELRALDYHGRLRSFDGRASNQRLAHVP